MKHNHPFLACLGVGLATFLGVWFLIGPLGGVFGLYPDAGPIVLFCLAAGAIAALLYRLHQRLALLELRTTYLPEQLDRLDPK